MLNFDYINLFYKINKFILYRVSMFCNDIVFVIDVYIEYVENI